MENLLFPIGLMNKDKEKKLQIPNNLIQVLIVLHKSGARTIKSYDQVIKQLLY